MKLTWLGHSCFLAEAEDAVVVFDPYAPGKVPGLRLPPLSADLVLSSHEHTDHFCPQAVKLTKRRVDVHLRQLETFHDGENGAKRGKNTVSVIELDGVRIAHLGDLGHLLSPEQLAAIGPLDVLLIPVGGYYTIDAGQARATADALKPRLTVPMHYRGVGFGFDVLSTVEPFAALSPDAVYLDSSVLDPSQLEGPATVILKCPT